MKRRKFIQNSALASASFMAGAGAYHFFGEDGFNLIEGEEWRNDRKVNPSDLLGLATDEEVLAESLRQIDSVRKANAVIHLTHDGQPIVGQRVEVNQVSHEMDWGFSHGGAFNDLENEKGRKKAEYISSLFNCATAKCYWNERWHQPIERRRGVRVYELFDQEIKWGEALNMRVKGHPLVWTVEKAIPTWVFQEPYTRQVEILKSHVQEMVAFGGDRVSKWDLCNEMLWEPAFKNIAKRKWPHIDSIDEIADYIAEALLWARAINPNAVYSLNDYGLVLTYIKEISAKQQRDRYLQLIEALRKRGVVPDATGSQAHIGGKFPLAAFKRMVDELASGGLPIQITEFWSQEGDFPNTLSSEEKEKAMAKYIGDIYTVAFANPAINHFTFWGYSQFFDASGEPKKAYETLDDLINNQWKTNMELTSDENGVIAFAGFKGEYELKIGTTSRRVNIVDDLSTQINFSG